MLAPLSKNSNGATEYNAIFFLYFCCYFKFNKFHNQNLIQAFTINHYFVNET